LPRYYFVVDFGDYKDEDHEGTWLPHASAARDYALHIIAELKRGEGYDSPDLMMIVNDAWEEELFIIPFVQPGRTS
jgi:Domain of unknown function (DUF6894)